MVRSVISSIADKASRRPAWHERDHRRVVLVHGYSPIENIVYGLIAAAVILSPILVFIVTCP